MAALLNELKIHVGLSFIQHVMHIVPLEGYMTIYFMGGGGEASYDSDAEKHGFTVCSEAGASGLNT